VAYGPKNLPEQGPVQIPRLNSGVLVTLTMKVDANPPDTIPLHIFSAMDAGSTKPEFGANFSMGDQSACDVTATQTRSNVIFTHGAVTTSGTPTPCVGDCNGNHEVIINELVIGVNIASPRSRSPPVRRSTPTTTGQVLINELILGVNNALRGCQ
jgi:hypothetical protein